MSWMDRIHEGRISQGGTYVEPGAFTVEVQKCKASKTRQGVENFIVELLIMESTNPNRPVGTLMDWYVDMSKEPSPGNVKEFIMIASKCQEAEVTKEVCQFVVSDANPLKGTRLRISASNIKTRAGKDFTKVRWFQPDDLGGQAAAQAQVQAAG